VVSGQLQAADFIGDFEMRMISRTTDDYQLTTDH